MAHPLHSTSPEDIRFLRKLLGDTLKEQESPAPCYRKKSGLPITPNWLLPYSIVLPTWTRSTIFRLNFFVVGERVNVMSEVRAVFILLLTAWRQDFGIRNKAHPASDCPSLWTEEASLQKRVNHATETNGQVSENPGEGLACTPCEVKHNAKHRRS